jgi:mRNA interferase MazF
VILQDDRYAARSPLIVAVPLSSSPGAARFPAVLSVPVTGDNGLTVDSFALVFQVRASDRIRVVRYLGFVTPGILASLHDALDQLTGRTRPAGGKSP